MLYTQYKHNLTLYDNYFPHLKKSLQFRIFHLGGPESTSCLRHLPNLDIIGYSIVVGDKFWALQVVLWVTVLPTYLLEERSSLLCNSFQSAEDVQYNPKFFTKIEIIMQFKVILHHFY